MDYQSQHQVWEALGHLTPFIPLSFKGEGDTKKPEGATPLRVSPASERQVWEALAPHWFRLRRHTRFRAELEEMAHRWRGGRLLNIGCAHGADFLPFPAAFELVGLDLSRRLLELGRGFARDSGFQAETVQGDARFLPFGDATFACAIAVAVYHHIRGEEGRRRAFGELYRVLQPGGEAFLTVWNRWQPRFWLKGREVMVPWRAPQGSLYRYHYLYSAGELRRELERAGLEVLRLFPEHSGALRARLPVKAFSRNLCALVRKPPSPP